MHDAESPIIGLSAKTLYSLPTNIAVPTYNRSDLSAGILHFGVGNFHRAHQADYLNDLFDLGQDQDWAIVGAGVKPSDEVMRQSLLRKDYLTSIVEQSSEHSAAKVIGPMIDILPTGDCDAIVARLADPQVRIVSMTITEGGYFINPATGAFDPEHVEIQRDIANPKLPTTVFGLIARGLQVRRAADQPPFTVMSCDNIPHNGEVTRNTLCGYTRLIDPELAEWIEQTVSFPNSMVDRITPATGDREREILKEQFGIGDTSPVFCEDFKQWVLEDKFCAGRPALEQVGVEFVDDVSSYELMKIRILNGGHAIIAYPAALLGIEFADEAMADATVKGFLEKVECEEIIPTVPTQPGVDRVAYFRQIVRRFSNPKIADRIGRLCLDGSNRQPKFIVPTVADRLSSGESVDGLALSCALWCRYCYGTSEDGQDIHQNDPNWGQLLTTARQAKSNPEVWLEMEDIYGPTGQNAEFVDAFSKALDDIWTIGTRTTLANYIHA